ncbi:hypothetical protein SUGI_0080820 [Cryptomeria japonica]|nr:hypothetical protein SUGI_0080820 [Cryptomeria japonica]
MATGKKKDKNDSSTEGEKEEDSNKVVPFHKLFVTTDSLDIIMMCIGSLGSMGIAVCLTIMVVLFGNLIDEFGSNMTNTKKVVHVVSKMKSLNLFSFLCFVS